MFFHNLFFGHSFENALIMNILHRSLMFKIAKVQHWIAVCWEILVSNNANIKRCPWVLDIQSNAEWMVPANHILQYWKISSHAESKEFPDSFSLSVSVCRSFSIRHYPPSFMAVPLDCIPCPNRVDICIPSCRPNLARPCAEIHKRTLITLFGWFVRWEGSSCITSPHNDSSSNQFLAA